MGMHKKFTKQELEQKIEFFFAWCEGANRPPTVERLCCFLDCDRQTLLNYQTREGYEEFFDTIRSAKQKIQAYMVENALIGETNSTLSIFLLKANHGYSETQNHRFIDGNGDDVKQITVNVVNTREEADKLK